MAKEIGSAAKKPSRIWTGRRRWIFQPTNCQSVFGTAHEYQLQVPATPNHGLVSTCGSYPSMFDTMPSTSAPTLPEGVYSATGLGIQNPFHQGFQGNITAETSPVA